MTAIFARWPATGARVLGLALAAVLAMPAGATSFASSASSAGSQLSGSLADSLQASSGSSSGDKKVAEGAYRIERVAAAPGKPNHLRLHLQATATPGADGALTLDLPRQAVAGQGLAVHALIELRHRPYGIEVAAAATQTAFFLLLNDEWQADLNSRAVTL